MAFTFLTSIPLGLKKGDIEKELVASIIFFPIVGLILGLVLFFFSMFLLSFLSNGIVASILIIVLMVLTGGLHLDGLADLCDGLAAGGSRERILSVMKDSRIGAFGVMGLVTLLILKYSLFFEVLSRGWLKAFLVMGLISRWTMVLSAFLGPYARKEGTARPFVGRISRTQCWVTSLLTISLALIIMKGLGLILFFISILLSLSFTHYLRFRIGGVTGDTLGAVNEITEVVVLLLFVLLFPHISW